MTYNILIVDDSATTRAVIKRTIQMAGIPVAEFYQAGDGGSALALVASRPIDLVLADLHMPEMSGIEMIRRLLADEATRRVPVVIVTAEPNAERIEELRRQGARGCVRKPFTPEAIRDVLTGILGVAHA